MVSAGSAAQGVLELSMAQASARNARAAIEMFLRKVMKCSQRRLHRRLQLNAA